MQKEIDTVVSFQENAIYTTEMTARILHRHPKTIRALCKRSILPARRDRGGYVITGWAIRAYAEGKNAGCVSANVNKTS